MNSPFDDDSSLCFEVNMGYRLYILAM